MVSTSLPARTTFAPQFRKYIATLWPIPLDAPVTTIFLLKNYKLNSKKKERAMKLV